MKRKPNFRILFRSFYTVTDTAVFSFILSVSIALLLHAHRKPAILALLFLGVFILCLIFHIRIAADRKRREIDNEEDRRKLELLLLMNDREIGKALGTDSFRMIRRAAPDEYDMLNAIRTGAKTIGIVKKTTEAETCLNRNAPDVELIDSRELIRRIFSTSIADNYRTSDITAFLNRVNKYFWLGGILFLSSFIAGFKIYFRMIACICLIIAPFSGFFGNPKSHKKLRIFLDKEEDR